MISNNLIFFICLIRLVVCVKCERYFGVIWKLFNENWLLLFKSFVICFFREIFIGFFVFVVVLYLVKVLIVLKCLVSWFSLW